MSRSRVEFVRRVFRWFSVAGIVALAPKCLLCLVAYSGAGAALGTALGGLEICGASTDRPGNAIAWLTMLGAVVGLVFARRLMTSHTVTDGLNVIGVGPNRKRGLDNRAIAHEEA